jgi:hypothetical protein
MSPSESFNRILKKRCLASDDRLAFKKNAPELLIGRFLKSKSLGGNRVILVDYEVLGLASDGRQCWMIFCLGLHTSWSMS